MSTLDERIRSLEESAPLPSANLKRPFRWAVLLGCVTFPLIWAGGLVTSTDAGMAVPDWPNTYGYNMFSYPFESWFFGPWDLFIEHGHRLLGSTAGLVAIMLVISTFRNSKNACLRWMSVFALLLVILQGLLGGVRVLAADRILAMVHGCVGPAFFAFSAAFATVLYQNSRSVSAVSQPTRRTKLQTLTICLTAGSFLQLVLGANMRHIEESASFHWFRLLVLLHVLFATVVLLLTVVIFIIRRANGKQLESIRGTSFLVTLFVIAQYVLGVGTWITKYHWPFGSDQFGVFAGLLTLDKSIVQTSIVTGHVAMGSLILMTSTVMMMQMFSWQITNQPIKDKMIETPTNRDMQVSSLGVQA